MSARIDESEVAKRRQQLFGDPWWRLPEVKRATDLRMFGSASEHCEICPLDPADLCHKPCMEARKELNDGIEVTVG